MVGWLDGQTPIIPKNLSEKGKVLILLRLNWYSLSKILVEEEREHNGQKYTHVKVSLLLKQLRVSVLTFQTSESSWITSKPQVLQFSSVADRHSNTYTNEIIEKSFHLCLLVKLRCEMYEMWNLIIFCISHFALFQIPKYNSNLNFCLVPWYSCSPWAIWFSYNTSQTWVENLTNWLNNWERLFNSYEYHSSLTFYSSREIHD